VLDGRRTRAAAVGDHDAAGGGGGHVHLAGHASAERDQLELRQSAEKARGEAGPLANADDDLEGCQALGQRFLVGQRVAKGLSVDMLGEAFLGHRIAG